MYLLMFKKILVSFFPALIYTLWPTLQPSINNSEHVCFIHQPYSSNLNSNNNNSSPDFVCQPDAQSITFRSPVDGPIVLAGTFGELRPNHFHAGIDIKTNNQVNKPIYAIADGFVSRIAVSGNGYGLALYIDHPNGYTSVYAHLNEYAGQIGDWVKNKQYSLQKFAIDVKPNPNELPVQAGQMVALSGNTGSSTSPHLHFEIRDTKTEHALNPLLFGFYVPDSSQPLVTGFGVYPVINGNQPLDLKIQRFKQVVTGSYIASQPVIFLNTPTAAMAIKAYDKLDEAHNWNGVYSVEMFENNQYVFGYTFSRIPFEESRYINSLVDYEAQKDGDGLFQKCFLDPGNNLSVYQNTHNKGFIDLSDLQVHNLLFLVKDVAGNTSTLTCALQYNPALPPPIVPPNNYQQFFAYDTLNKFTTDLIELIFPKGVFYTDIPFQYKMRYPSAKEIEPLSPVHTVHQQSTPVHSAFDVAIKPNANIIPELMDKALIVMVNRSGKKSCGGKWDNGWLRGKAKAFGDFYIALDIKAPTINPINISNGKRMSKAKHISFGISDNLSGIDTYNGYLDGQWVLMSYDAKTSIVRHYLDPNLLPGEHSFTLEVTDERQNKQVFTANFIK